MRVDPRVPVIIAGDFNVQRRVDYSPDEWDHISESNEDRGQHCATCEIVRTWCQPEPSNAMNTDLLHTFNRQVECDLVFICKITIFHMVDRCIR